MRASGITDLVTLLSKTEGAEQIGQQAISDHVSRIGCRWMGLIPCKSILTTLRLN
jgi:hypothetical protein